MNTMRSHHGCHRYCTVRVSLIWVFRCRFVQFRQTTSGAEIRTRRPHASHTGRIDQKAADVTGDLHFGDGLSGIGRDRDRVRLFCYITLCREWGASGSVTTIGGGSTRTVITGRWWSIHSTVGQSFREAQAMVTPTTKAFGSFKKGAVRRGHWKLRIRTMSLLVSPRMQ